MASGPRSELRLAVPALERLAPHLRRTRRVEEDRLPAVGDLGDLGDALGTERGDRDRDVGARHVVDQLEWLAQARPAALARQRNGVVPAVVHHGLAPPGLPADLHDLAGAPERRVVRHAVEALDHLRSGCAEPERETARRQRIEARGSHRGERRGARIQLEDVRHQTDAPRLRREVAEATGGVERVRLSDGNRVEPCRLVDVDGVRDLSDVGRIVLDQSEPHRPPASRRASAYRGLYADRTARESALTGQTAACA